ncbi:MAG TPA: hypothetical protein VNE67_02800 [Acetobacteraceae bacterium]|nr:hypothetical protein [Acetobacteraceae bacterium]
MSNRPRFRLLAPLLLLGAALALGGCVVSPDGYYGGYGYPYAAYPYPPATVSFGWGGGWYHGDHDWDGGGWGGDWHGHGGGWHH